MLPARVRSDRVALRHYIRHINPFLRYSFDYGPIHAVCLDSGEDAELIKVAAFGSGLSDDDLLWLEDNLKDREHSFVFTHHPATRAGSKDELKRRYNIGCITKNRMQFMNLCSKYGVAAVFSGHEHVDEHWSEGGVEYYMTPSATRSREESGFRLVKLTREGGYHTELITIHAQVIE
jgi:3',5'-cyclic AMP phosphodiesterase CpdA